MKQKISHSYQKLITKKSNNFLWVWCQLSEFFIRLPLVIFLTFNEGHERRLWQLGWVRCHFLVWLRLNLYEITCFILDSTTIWRIWLCFDLHLNDLWQVEIFDLLKLFCLFCSQNLTLSKFLFSDFLPWIILNFFHPIKKITNKKSSPFGYFQL